MSRDVDMLKPESSLLWQRNSEKLNLFILSLLTHTNYHDIIYSKPSDQTSEMELPLQKKI